MSQITIAGKQFEVEAPFSEGHVLSAGEAYHLNQTFMENVRNNMAKAVREGKGQDEVSKYASEYVMKERGESSGAGVSRDPVITEARSLARTTIKMALKNANQTASKEQLNSAIDAILAHPEQGPKFRAAAEQRVAERTASAEAALAGVTAALASATAS